LLILMTLSLMKWNVISSIPMKSFVDLINWVILESKASTIALTVWPSNSWKVTCKKGIWQWMEIKKS
jgi:hypothetical protein